jgi:hypothetical protein
MRSLFSRFMILLPTLVVLPLVSFAQFSQRGSIGGVVTESSGAVVANASVKVLDVQRNQTSSASTDTGGHYEFSQLLIGSYQVSVEAAGFKKSVSDILQVSSQSALRYDIKLQLGAVSETVAVTASAPLLESDHAALDQSIDQQQIADLPMNGRNVTSLADLTPGVSTSPRTNINVGGTYEVGATYESGGVQYAAGGITDGSRDNGFYVNGVNANENYESGISYQPSAEAIGEMKIGVADFSAEYGRDFTNFNVTTKAGSNTFHGEVYDFIENDGFNALNPFDKERAFPGTAVKSAYRRNQFGGGLGGPVYIPKFLNLKDRAFFFANYERFPQSLAGGNNYAIVPSDAERTGNFAELCTAPDSFNGSGVCSNPNEQLYNPYTNANVPSGFSRQPIPFNNLNNITRPDGSPAIDPASANIAALFPHANVAKSLANGGQNYQYQSTQAVTTYTWDSRFDYRITSKDNAFVTWSRYHGTSNNSGGVFPEYIGNIDDKSYLITVDEAHVFSPHLTNEFIFSTASGALATLTPQNVAFLNSSANPFNKIFANTGTLPGGNTGILALNIIGYATPGFNEYFRAENDSRQFSDNVSWVHGSHSMTFGFNYIRKSELDFDTVRYVGFGCTGYYCDNGPDLFTASGSDLGQVGGDGFAEVLLGLPKVIHQRYNYTAGGPFAPEPNFVLPYYGAFFNDKLQLTKRLTVSFGLRYELPIPIYATNNLCCAIYQPATDTTALPGIAPGIPQQDIPAPKHDFAPRLSLAMQVRPKLVVRAGYGLFYDSGASQISNYLNGQAEFGAQPGASLGDEITPTSLGANDQDPVTSLSQIFQASPQIPLGTYPVSTGRGQGYFGAGQFTTIYTLDNKSAVTPYFHRYMLDIQREVARDSVITLSYIGAEGREGGYVYDENVPPYRTLWPSFSAFTAARPFNSGRFGDIYVERAGLNSNYNAGIVKFERRMTNGLQILTHYTYAKTLSDTGQNGQTSGLGYRYPQSVIRSYGEANLSHRHRFVFQTNYQPKYSQHLPTYLRPALGDWHISAIATLESGDALPVTDQNDPAQDYAGPFCPFFLSCGIGTPNTLRNPNLPHSNRTFAEYFDVNAFSEPPLGVRGNASPGIIRGPGQNNWDIAFGKSIAFHERLHAEIRADMFNAFNHTQWTSVDTTFNDTLSGFQFGQVTGGREGRIIQLGAKIVF